MKSKWNYTLLFVVMMYTQTFAQEDYCQPIITQNIIDSVTINGQTSPYILSQWSDDSVKLTLTNTALTPDSTFHWKGWIDMNENYVFEETEVFLLVAHVSEPELNMVLNLPDSMILGHAYNIRFAVVNDPTTTSCAGGIIDYVDGSMLKDTDPFTVEIDNTSGKFREVIEYGEEGFCKEINTSFLEPIRVLFSSPISYDSNLTNYFLKVSVLDYCGNSVTPTNASYGLYVIESNVQNDGGQMFIDVSCNFEVAVSNCVSMDGFGPYLMKIELFSGSSNIESISSLVGNVHVAVNTCSSETNESTNRVRDQLIDDISECFSVFPNPVINEVFIKYQDDITKNRRYTILDFEGKKVKSIQSEQEEVRLDMSGVPRGIYLLILDEGKEVKRIIKE